MFNPHRLHRSDWWADWRGETHAVVHFVLVDWKTLSYKDSGQEGADATRNVRFNPRGAKVVELIKKTGIVLIQKSGDKMASAGWHSAWTVKNFRVGLEDGSDNWISFNLDKRLA